MSNLTTFEQRAAFQGVFINDDVRRFEAVFSGDNLNNLITGLMIVFGAVVILGRIANSSQAAMLVDLMQAVAFSTKLVAIVVRAITWGILGI